MPYQNIKRDFHEEGTRKLFDSLTAMADEKLRKTTNSEHDFRAEA